MSNSVAAEPVIRSMNETTPSAQPPSSPRSHGHSKLAFLWRFGIPLLCLFQSSLLAGWLLLARTGDPVASDVAQESAKPGPAAEKPSGLASKTTANAEELDPRTGEALLKAGNYTAALEHFQPVEPGAKSGNADRLAFCTGLCLEGLGRWKEALAAYRQAVTTTTESSRHSRWGGSSGTHLGSQESGHRSQKSPLSFDTARRATREVPGLCSRRSLLSCRFGTCPGDIR